MNKRDIMNKYIETYTLFHSVDDIKAGRVAWILAQRGGIIPQNVGYEDSWDDIKDIFPNAIPDFRPNVNDTGISAKIITDFIHDLVADHVTHCDADDLPHICSEKATRPFNIDKFYVDASDPNSIVFWINNKGFTVTVNE